MSEAPVQTQPAEKLEIRPLGPEHVDGALALSRQVGWPHRKEDWDLALAVSEGVVATEGDRVTGTACCSRFGSVALINMIIVDEAMRGRGLGRRLMEAAMALGAGDEMRLVATREGLPLYEKLGFTATHQILQHQGIARAAAPQLVVRDGSLSDIGRLAELDRGACGLERQALLERIAAQGQVLLAEDGFALLREFGRGHVVGPVVAKDAAVARALIAEAASRTEGRFLRIDLPEAAGLSEFVTALGLEHVGGGTAMVRTPAPATPSDYTTYALVSQALG
ncbi:GNAT family N-acetyltransferase [Roseovarius atlanticus]|uniref:GNAT family N-acetyltransferase n=1 Tax=Roseovarius atlanticus TaxID=1641875 RepID=UPI001C96286A|nr:GNAT family N-acetyltransferase [Roseovarius atlanticus]MBY5987751.1 GNAT family N-acetyltransferase [Roseovarius atlanticus]MBY6123142.1 GNAT family N-acetyltransferase [Roseovarius atlanticus]MBY6147638.1 GNAT family N-acetyltransferase [Roseovarius atlanticus]